MSKDKTIEKLRKKVQELRKKVQENAGLKPRVIQLENENRKLRAAMREAIEYRYIASEVRAILEDALEEGEPVKEDELARFLEGVETIDGAEGRFGAVRWRVTKTSYGYRVSITYPDGTVSGHTYHHDHLEDARRDILIAHQGATGSGGT